MQRAPRSAMLVMRGARVMIMSIPKPQQLPGRKAGSALHCISVKEWTRRDPATPGVTGLYSQPVKSIRAPRARVMHLAESAGTNRAD
jgi:hypothetical protein